MQVVFAGVLAVSAAGSPDSPCEEAKACVESGLQAHRSERFDEARTYFEEACEKGVAFGCRAVGANLRAGLGGERDTLKGINYFKRACEMGDQQACHEVGFTLEFYGEPSIEAALSAYASSCSRGYAKSCEAGVTRAMGTNRVEWAKHLGAVRENCEAGELLTSCGIWGAALSRGFGVDRDIVEARRFFRKACGKYQPWCRRMWLAPGGKATAWGLGGVAAASIVLGAFAARRSRKRVTAISGLVSILATLLSTVNFYFRTLFGPWETVFWLVSGVLMAVGIAVLLRRLFVPQTRVDLT